MNHSSQSEAPLKLKDNRRTTAPVPWSLYAVEALASAGTNLLITAIFFYTKDRFHWTLKQNFLLACGQGVFYIAGAMTAGGLARRFDQRAALAGVYAAMALSPLLAYFADDRPAVVTCLLLVYSYTSTCGWPIIESLVTGDVDSHAMSRRVSTYNLVWAIVGVIMLAIVGWVIVHHPAAMFLIPVAVHGASSIIMAVSSRKRRAARRDNPFSEQPTEAHHAHIPDDVEPELLRVRTLALWLSRVALPATYVVIFSLMALMPSLPVMRTVSPALQPVVASAWMATRLLAFLLLGMGTWWHTRPRLLLLASIVMLIAFVGTTIRPSDLLGHGSPAIDLTTMLLAQLALGLALGMIYFGSLYFGMALSEGSTEHGGYHEALIGVGFVVGPGTGALAQIVRPHDVNAGIIAVAAVVVVSVVAVGVTAVVGSRRTLGEN